MIHVEQQKETVTVQALMSDDTTENAWFGYFQKIWQLFWTFWYCRI